MSEIFKILESNVDVSKILKQLNDNPNDWTEVRNIKNIYGNFMSQFFLPLTIGVVNDRNVSIYDAEDQENTHLYQKYNEMTSWLVSRGFANHSRAAFFKLPIGGSIGLHDEQGKYYASRDRFHLSIQGRYRYLVGGEEYIIEPGTFFWFDNKLMHAAYNIDTVERISFVWDAPYGTIKI